MFVMLFTDSTESGSGSSVLTASSEMRGDDVLSIFCISRQVFDAWNQTKTKQNRVICCHRVSLCNFAFFSTTKAVTELGKCLLYHL